MTEAASSYATSIGKEIRAEREAVEMTQADLAEAIDVSDSTISNWERGTATISALSLARLKAIFREKRKGMQRPEVTR